MSVHSDVITYRWTQLDRMGATFASAKVTPYAIPSDLLSKASKYKQDDLVEISLGLSDDAPTVARFFRDGYEWIDVPEEAKSSRKVADLFGKLYELDKVRFGHLDPLLNMASTAARNVANLADLDVTALFDPSMLPFGDLAVLHLEYWGNTDWRAAIIKGTVSQTSVNLGFTRVNIPWFGTDVLSMAVATLVPLALPTEKSGTRIKKVLARKALRGAPVRTILTEQEEASGKTAKVVSLPAPRIELDGFTKQTLSPLREKEWKLRESKLLFRITLPSSAAETRIDILKAGNLYYSETHKLGEFIVPGLHIWGWDGYDNDGVFDSVLLKQNDLIARVTVTDFHGRTAVGQTDLGSAPDKIKWTDVRVESKDKRIYVTTWARFSHPSEVELGTLKLDVGPLADALNTVMGATAKLAGAASKIPGGNLLGMIPGIDKVAELDDEPWAEAIVPALTTGELALTVNLPPILDVDAERFARMKTAICAGIGRHWSRKVTIEGETWQLIVSCRTRSKDAVRTFIAKALPLALQDLGIGDGSDFAQGFGSRSFNLATFAEGLPIVNIWEDDDDVSEADLATGLVTDIDAKRAEVGAHELGHSVLRECLSIYESLTHKGSSTVGQAPSPAALGFPSTGEIDIMLYTADGSGRPKDWQGRTKAVEPDALGLVSMGKVSFG